MVVTDPTIDPITNLPVLNPQDVIQQIPLGVQTFPYEDLQATSRPTRGPLYGDDILPTSAFLAGQNPSTGSAQTVETDGSHAAKVFVVNGTAGGGGVSPIIDPQVSAFFHGTSPDALAIHQFTAFPFTIYGFSIGYTINPAIWSPPVGSSIQVYLAGDTTNKQLYLAAGYMKLQVAPNVTEMAEHRLDWPYNAPLQFTAASFPGDTSVTLHFNCQNIDIDYSAAFLYS